MADGLARTAEVTRALRALRARFPGGVEMPSERRLAEEIGVTRHVLRRALADLREAGEMPEPRRIPVAESAQRLKLLSHTNPVELSEIRIVIEPPLARMAAMRATPDQLARIDALHRRSDPEVFDFEIDIAFHTAIAEASRNSIALHVIDTIMALTRDPLFKMQLPAFTRETGHGYHEEINAALQARGGERAEAAMRKHLVAINGWLSGFPAPVEGHRYRAATNPAPEAGLPPLSTQGHRR